MTGLRARSDHSLRDTLESIYGPCMSWLWSNQTAREDIMPLHSWMAHCNVNLWLLPLKDCLPLPVGL